MSRRGPTPKQLSLIESLSEEIQLPAPQPQSVGAASKEIQRLLAIRAKQGLNKRGTAASSGLGRTSRGAARKHSPSRRPRRLS